MTVLYGQRGQAVGSIVGDAIFDRTGSQIAQVIDGYMYRASDGEWIGSVMSGVVFNTSGAPQAFTLDCEEVLLPPPPPLIESALPVRLPQMGDDVSALPEQRPPQFLRAWLESSASTSLRDGYFV